MKTRYFPRSYFISSFILFCFQFLSYSSFSQTCNNWVQLLNQPSYVRVGDLDIPGNKVTVEALINRTAPWNGVDLFQGDVVSKHEDPKDCNYLLRPSSAEITTTNGYFKTPVICPIELNKTYHVAMVYDGTALKFYRNGYLMSQVAASGSLIQNDWQTQIGLYFNQVTQENFIGYINEVRIWNVARSQQEIKSFMAQSLPAPETTSGLLAYYTFDNLINKQGNAAWNGTLSGSASINRTNGDCKLVVDSCGVKPPPVLNDNCSSFQLAFGGTKNDRAYDIAASLNNEFYVAGVTKSEGNGDEISITKHRQDGTLLWSKVYGHSKNESVRKVAATTDGGLLIIGQTNSYNNSSGEILCFKINKDGQLVWWKQLGVGSASGDLGMDIIETTDGGYALTGILNVNGTVADMVVIKLNASANLVWSKRFDRGDGEDGVGILQKGDTLIVASDLQNNLSQYEMQVMKLKLADGAFIMSKKLTPAKLGIFNPYLYKDPTGKGYYISGHQIDITSYANMKHTIIALDEAFNITYSKVINVTPVTNDFYTGFVPLSDGSFITSAAPQNNPDGYIFSIKNNTIQYAQKLNKPDALRLYRLTVVGQQVVAVGSIMRNGQEDIFMTGFPVEGMPKAFCDVENVNVSLETPTYTASDFTWPTIDNITFSSPQHSFQSGILNWQMTNLCPSPCDSIKITGPEKVCSADTVLYDIYRSADCTQDFDISIDNSFGEVVARSNTSIKVVFKKEGSTKIKVLYNNSCKLVVDEVDVTIKFSPKNINLGKDVITCADTAFLLSAEDGFESYQWADGYLQQDVEVTTPGVYYVTALNACGDTFSDTLTYQKVVSQPFSVSISDSSVCKGDTVIFGAVGGHLYNWQPATYFNTPLSQNATAVIQQDQAFTLKITDSVCNRDTTYSIFVEARELPKIKVVKSNDVNCTMDSARLTASGAISYSWKPALYASDLTSGSVVVKPFTDIVYTVTGKDAYGCTGIDSIEVRFLKTGNQNMYVPSAFTPNNDGLNDVFKPSIIGRAVDYHFKVYNRWGQLIFYSTDPQKGWNGVYKSIVQPGGVYVYSITANGVCNGKFVRNGTFVLIR